MTSYLISAEGLSHFLGEGFPPLKAGLWLHTLLHPCFPHIPASVAVILSRFQLRYSVLLSGSGYRPMYGLVHSGLSGSSELWAESVAACGLITQPTHLACSWPPWSRISEEFVKVHVWMWDILHEGCDKKNTPSWFLHMSWNLNTLHAWYWNNHVLKGNFLKDRYSVLYGGIEQSFICWL